MLVHVRFVLSPSGMSESDELGRQVCMRIVALQSFGAAFVISYVMYRSTVGAPEQMLES